MSVSHFLNWVQLACCISLIVYIAMLINSIHVLEQQVAEFEWSMTRGLREDDGENHQ